MRCPVCRLQFADRDTTVAHVVTEHDPRLIAQHLLDTTLPNGDVPCHRLQRYASKPLAAMALVLTAPLPRRPYFCGGCGGYHLRTHQPTGRTR